MKVQLRVSARFWVLPILVCACFQGHSAIEVRLTGTGGGTKRVTFTDGSSQFITYQSDVSLFLHPTAPVRSGQFFRSSQADVEGSIRFRGHAEDDYFDPPLVWDFDVTRNYSSPTALQLDFLEDGRVYYIESPLVYGTDTSQPRITGFKFVAASSTITNLILLPDDWFFSDRFPSPGTSTVSGAEGRMGGTVRDICSGAPLAGVFVQVSFGTTLRSPRISANLADEYPGFPITGLL